MRIAEPFKQLDLSALAAADRCVALSVIVFARTEADASCSSRDADAQLLREVFDRLVMGNKKSLVWYLSIAYECSAMALIDWLIAKGRYGTFTCAHLARLCAAHRRFARIFPGALPTCRRMKGYFYLLEGREAKAVRSWRKGAREAERYAMEWERLACTALSSYFAAGAGVRSKRSIAKVLKSAFMDLGTNSKIVSSILDHACAARYASDKTSL